MFFLSAKRNLIALCEFFNFVLLNTNIVHQVTKKQQTGNKKVSMNTIFLIFIVFEATKLMHNMANKQCF